LFKTSTLHIAALAIVSLVVVLPFFWLGNPSGHDFEFHMYSWMDVLSQWKQGIVYPTWGALEHWGYGEARFVFYPPASWTLGAGLGAVLPWHAVPGTYIWIALFAVALSMFHLARHWLPVPDALFASALYVLNPYHLVIIYWRSAFAELLASALLPLILMCVMSLEDRSFRPVLWLSLVLSAAWLTNAPAAVMVHYSLAFFAVVVAVVNRSWRPLVKSGEAILLAAGLAGFYLLPAIYEEKWVNISEVLAPGVRPIDNFLFTTTADPDHNRFNLLVSVIAIMEIAAVAAAIWFSREWRKKQRSLWPLLSAWAAVSAGVMLSITNFFWEHLPKLRFVQLPWRWLLCLNAALALLLTMAVRTWSVRIIAVMALTAATGIAGHRIQPPWWDHASDIREMANAMANGTGNEGTDEYVPAGADPYELDRQKARFVVCNAKVAIRECVCGIGIAASDCDERPGSMLTWGAEENHFVMQAPVQENLVLRLFNYPAWKVTVNGEPVRTATSDVTGQMVIPVQAGTNDISIRFERTPDRTVGDAMSVFFAGIFLALWWKARQSL
jgi:hypothetical protein